MLQKVLLSLVGSAILYLAVFLRIRSDRPRVGQAWKSRLTWKFRTSNLPHAREIPSSTLRIARLMLWYVISEPLADFWTDNC